MSLSGILANQILVIFIIIIIGVICYRSKLIDDRTNSKLSDILLTLVNPVVIFVSYQREFTRDLLEGLLISLILSLVTHIVSIIISYIMIRRKRRKTIVVDGVSVKKYVDNQDVEVERFSSIYSNVGFMGIPLVNGIFGSEGVFYVSASLTIFNIFVWTHGVYMMSGSRNMKLKEILKTLTSPTIVAILLGLLLFILQISLPNVMYEALTYIANLNTPFAMLIAGVTIGKTNIIQLLTKKIRKYYISFLRLLLIPLVIVFMFIWLPINDMVKITAILMAATPTATMCTLFAIKHEKNSVLAAEIFTICTLLSVITIPIVIRIVEILL